MKNQAVNYDEKSKSLKEHLNDYLTVDIATEWEKPLMDLVYKLFNRKILTENQVSSFEIISNRFQKFSPYVVLELGTDIGRV